MFALIDCNNFYAGCEKLFRPDLAHKPVVVLSNNDGCVIARSAEAKAMGIPMGAPWFKVKSQIATKGVIVFLSNYALYGDLSDRVCQVLAMEAREMEVYSIDEMFMDVEGIQHPEVYGLSLRNNVQMWTGLTVGVGIGKTKTLAKSGNFIAKKVPKFGGVFHMHTPRHDIDKVLDYIPVGEVWGIGRQYEHLLLENRISTAKALRDADERWIRQKLTVMGLRTVLELRGIPCYGLAQSPLHKKNITCSRSFGQPLTKRDDIKEAIAFYVHQAAEKLRGQSAVCGALTVFITTKFHGDMPHYANQYTITFPESTAYTPQMIGAAHLALCAIFKSGFAYKKAGVMLHHIARKHHIQGDLFSEVNREKQYEMMDLVDKINRKYGRHTITFGLNTHQDHIWRMNQARRSPRYTTRWQELKQLILEE